MGTALLPLSANVLLGTSLSMELFATVHEEELGKKEKENTAAVKLRKIFNIQFALVVN